MIISNSNIATLNGDFPTFLRPATIDFYNRFVADGGSLSADLIRAINWYIASYQNENLWNKALAIYLFMGGSGTAQSIANFRHNLVSSSYKLTANNITAAMCTVNGYTGNGSNSYWDSTLKPLLALTTGSNGMSFYSRTNNVGGNYVDMGTNTAPSDNFQLIARFSGAAPNVYWDSLSATGARVTGSITVSDGFISGSRTSSTSSTLTRNGVLINSISTTAGSLQNANVFLGACNINGGASNYTNRNYTCFAIHGGYTNGEELIRYKIQQTFERWLGRAIEI